MNNNEVEIWADIPNLTGRFAVSNYGNIKNVKTGRIRKQRLNNYGYSLICLYVTGKRLTFSVSRLVGFAFVSGYMDGAEINHKDLNKANNHYTNLEWTTRVGNMQHAMQNRIISRKGTVTAKHIASMSKLWKSVYAYDPDTKDFLRFDSYKQCAEKFGVNRSTISSTIITGCRLRRKYRLFKEEPWMQFKSENNL